MKKIFSLNKKEYLIFGLIFLLAFLTRVIKLTKIPIAFNRDELAIAYNAFSIAQTGHDERGIFLPVNIESFGDWKLPGYIYTLVPLIKIFGLNDVVVKLPSVLAGLGIILINFFLIRLWLEKNQHYLAFVLMFFLSVLPWAVHISRIAYEANLALFFFSLGLFCFELFKNFYQQEKKIKSILLFLSGLGFFISIVTYHAFQIVSPLFLAGLVILEKDFLFKLFKKNKKFLLTPVLLFASLCLIFFFAGTKQATLTKGSGLLIFNHKYQHQIDINRNFLSDKPILAKLYSNSFVYRLADLRDNFFKTLSWDFLFTVGGKNATHNISLIGNFYPYEIIFILIGLFYFLNEKKIWQKKVMLCLGVALVAPIITLSPNHSIRFIAGLIPLEILSVFGFYKILLRFNNKNFFYKICLLILLATIFIYSWFYYFTSYYFVAPKKDIDKHNWVLKELGAEIWKRKNDYNIVMTDEAKTSFYIYLLYYRQYNPSKLKENLFYYPHDKEGFSHVQSLENIIFALPNFTENENKNYDKILYVLKKWQIPEYLWTEGHYKHLKEFKNENASQTYVMFEYRK